MVVDLSLTYDGAKARMGNPIPMLTIGEAGYHNSPVDFLKEVRKLADKSRFGFEYDPDGLWKLRWKFDRDSEIVKTWERRCELKRLKPGELTVQRYMDAARDFDYERINTLIHMAFDNYAKQVRRQLMFSGDNMMLEAVPSHEALWNAIEHGSDFCRKGQVTFSFHGGEYGVVTSADDPGQGCIIQSTPKEMQNARRLMLRKEAGLVKTERGLMIHSGFGKFNFNKTTTTVGSEKRPEGGFRVFAAYLIPAEEDA